MRNPAPWNIPSTPFTLAQVAPHGVTRDRLTRAIDSGLVVVLRRGVYISSSARVDDPVPDHLTRALAEEVRHPDLIACRETAALHHGLALHDTPSAAAGRTQFYRGLGSERRSRRTQDRHIHLHDIPDHHVTRAPSGLLVTSAARTAVDLASDLPIPQALMLLDAALRLELTDMTGTLRREHYRDTRLQAAARRPLEEAATHVHGSRGARLRSTLALADSRRESPLESVSAGHFMVAGLPRPVHQARIVTPSGTFYPDNLWEEYMLIGEADGAEKYEDPARVTAEKLRDGAFTDSGYGLIHWAGAEMWRSPQAIVDRVGRMLMARGWDGVPVRW